MLRKVLGYVPTMTPSTDALAPCNSGSPVDMLCIRSSCMFTAIVVNPGTKLLMLSAGQFYINGFLALTLSDFVYTS